MLLDLVLPLMSGLQLAQQLKSDPATRDVVIIVVSAFNGDDTERSVLDAGCAMFVRKPIDALTFTQSIVDSLGRGHDEHE